MPPSNKRKRADTHSSPDQGPAPQAERSNAQARADSSKKMVAACTACRKQKVRETVHQLVRIQANTGVDQVRHAQ